MDKKIIHTLMDFGIIIIIVLILITLSSCVSWTPDTYIDPIKINKKIRVVNKNEEDCSIDYINYYLTEQKYINHTIRNTKIYTF